MSEWVDLLDSANQKYDNVGSGLAADNVQAAIDEIAGVAGVPEAPDNSSRTYARQGTTNGWELALKGYGEVEQATAAAGALTVAVGDGNRIYSGLTGAVSGITLTADITVMDCTWVLQHNGNNVTFPASFKFPGGTAPSTASGNAWLLGLFTRDGGTNWIVSYVEDYTL